MTAFQHTRSRSTGPVTLRRAVALAPELRAEGDGPTHIVGHGALFDSPTTIRDWFGEYTEEIAPGAFAKTIREADVRALFNHDPNIVLGRNRAGTLALSEDSRGLLYDITPPDTSAARDLIESMRRGDVNQSSFAFSVVREQWTWAKREGEIDKRRLLEVKLYDVSPVTYPAYEDADSGLRAADLGLAPDDFLSIRRAFRGAALSQVDHEALHRTVNALRSFLPAAPAPSEDSHPAEQDPTAPAAERSGHPVAVLRRKLELLAIETAN